MNIQRSTVKISKMLAEKIDEYLKKHDEELLLQGLRVSRATVVTLAVKEFLIENGIIEP